MTISERKVVSIHYKVADAASAEVFDSSEGGDPMIYLHGAQNIIPGLEQALEGKAVGDEFVVTVESADAYGDYSEDRIAGADRSFRANGKNRTRHGGQRTIRRGADHIDGDRGR